MNRSRSAVAALAFASAAAFAVLAGEAAVAQTAATATASAGVKRADLRGTTVSREVQHVADWAVHSGDHQRLPFIIVDKVNAKALAFDAGGRLLQTTPVLLGMGVGDAFPPGVVNMDMHETQPWQRITPAGRFVAEEGVNLKGQSVLWVDYDNAIAIHRLPARRTSQKRHERIASGNPADHRITYGCINVAPAFYDQVVLHHFRQRGGIVYVLPDTLPLKNVLKTYSVGSQPVATPVQRAVRSARGCDTKVLAQRLQRRFIREPHMSVSTPLKFCYHGQHYRPREQFKALPGGTHRREVCADCYAKIMADRKQKRREGLLKRPSESRKKAGAS